MNDICVEDNGPDKGDGESDDAIVWESDLDYGQSEQLHDEFHEGDHLGEKLPLQMSTSKDEKYLHDITLLVYEIKFYN